MVKKLFYVFSMLFCFLAFGFTIAENPLQEIIAKLERFTGNNPQEKVHLQLDKPYYIAGEDIWIKSYIVTAQKNEPSTISKILYVELINPENEIAKKIILAVDSGRAFGNITIPDSLASGNYRIRAFTNYMRNYDEDFFFEKFISISTLTQRAEPKKENSKHSLDVQFFAEGGNLVYGLRNKIGVKSIDESGMGVNVTGYILDNDEQKVAIFSTEHFGMGSFALTPSLGQHYKAIIEKADGTSQAFKLPKIMESGYALAINSTNIKDSISIKISMSKDLVNGQEISLLGQTNGEVYFTMATKSDHAILAFNLPKKRFPTGIAQFTMFANANPVAERIFFVNHNDQVKINITSQKIQPFSPPKAGSNPVKPIVGEVFNLLDLFITDQNGNPLDGNFSAAIVDANKVIYNEDDERTILSNLLLTSDLKGFIEKPNYYFNPSNAQREKYLDDLLLTQGWRRFAWNEVLADKNPILTYKPEKSLAISGHIVDLKNDPVKNAKVRLMSTSDGFSMILDTLTDDKGNFAFDRMDIPDSVNFIVQAKTAKGDKNVRVVLDKHEAAIQKRSTVEKLNAETYISNAKLQYYGSSIATGDGINLNTVNIIKKREIKPIVNIPNSKSRNGSADYVITKERFQDRLNGSIFDLFGAIPGVKIQNGEIIRSKSNTTSMAPNFKGKPQPMLVILDGSPLSSQAPLGWMSAASVEGIEVLVSNYNTAIYEDGYWGVILITTKSGAADPVKSDPTYNISQISSYGFTPVKEFYTPKFDANNPTKKQPNGYQLRSTIYWNPNIYSDLNGKAHISFASNKNAKCQIIIEGMDNYGNLGRKVYNYQPSK